MTCTVTLCDTSFAAITAAKIDIEAYDPPGVRSIDLKSNSSLGGGDWGAVLSVASTDIYDVVIDTSHTSFASPVLENLNGAASPRLDVVLLSTSGAISAGSTGSPPRTAAGLPLFILGQSWSVESKRAILICITTLGYLKRLPPTEFPGLRDFLNGLLRRLRIDPDIV
jgi:hypothetical protein